MSARCKDSFDYSDHIVLYIVQYIFIAVIELTYITVRRSMMQTPFSNWAFFGDFISASTAFTIIYYSLRGVLFTSMYFHSVTENLAAVVIVVLFAAAPLVLFANSNIWYKISIGTLKPSDER